MRVNFFCFSGSKKRRTGEENLLEALQTKMEETVWSWIVEKTERKCRRQGLGKVGIRKSFAKKKGKETEDA